MIISAAKLRELGVCAAGIRQFVSVFGGDAEVTPENVRRAIDAGLGVGLKWLAPGQYAQFKRAVTVAARRRRAVLERARRWFYARRRAL